MRLDDEKFGEMSPYGVRLPSELKAKIKAAAKENRHSMNAEIINRLERTFLEDFARLEDSPTEAKEVDALLVEITQKIEAVKLAVDRFEKLKIDKKV